MSEENIGLVRGLYEAFNKGDVDAVLGSFDENIDWYEAEGMPQGGHYQGPQNVRVQARDMLGRVYEYFLGQFASAEGKKGGEFYTPRCIVRLLVEMLEPKPGERVYDPTVGTGGMLISSLAEVKRRGGDVRRRDERSGVRVDRRKNYPNGR